MKIVYTLAFRLVEVDLDSDEVSHGFHRLSFCIRHSALGLMLMKSTHVALQGLAIQHVLHADPKRSCTLSQDET